MNASMSDSARSSTSHSEFIRLESLRYLKILSTAVKALSAIHFFTSRYMLRTPAA